MRFLACSLSSVALLPLAAAAQTAAVPPVTTPLAATSAAWIAQGSDIPVDPSWRFGTLPNGLHYAVRRSAQPAGTIAVRIRVGAGGLTESDTQQGWSHMLEHMTFRGTAHHADGEGIRIWQRLGASFGADTNAATTLTATTFQLDLPRADVASYREALSVMAEMVDSARIDPKLLATERQVVEAELAMRLSPLTRKFKDAQQPLLYAGTKAAVRDVLGTPAILDAATADALRAYYQTWYRPDNATVVVAGDADPAMLEAELRRAFSAWRPTLPMPPAPDWGAPAAPAVPVASISDPQAPDTVLLSFVSPHADGPMTAARQQAELAETVAIGILNQRLAAAARRDEAIVNAGLQQVRQRHIEDQLLLSLQVKPGQWATALKQAFAVLNGAAASPPDQGEIDQQAAAITTALAHSAESEDTDTAATLADSVINDVEQGDVTGARDYYVKLFATERAGLTPAAIQAVTKRLLAPAPRLFVSGTQPVAGGDGALREALTAAQHTAGGASARLRAVSLDDLKLAGSPAAIASTTPIAAFGAERVRFADGVELIVKRTAFEKDRVRVRVEIGSGLLGQPVGDVGLWWTAPALIAGGIGPFAPDELARVTAGRQIGFGVGAGLDGLAFAGTTNAADLPDMLRLMTGAIVAPRFDPTVTARLRAAALANYASIYSQPSGVLSAFGGAALHGGDGRFQALPPRDTVAALTPADFQRFWTAKLAQGPVRVTIVGDVDPAMASAAVARTLGTLPPRAAAPSGGEAVAATPPAAPVVLRHQGDPGQALVLRAFPTLGLTSNPGDTAALDLASAVVQQRLLEGFRETEGATYTPLAAHQQSDALPRWGVFIAGAQVQAARVDGFGHSLDIVVADLAAHAVKPDEFARAQTTAISADQRNRENNEWWLGQLSAELTPAFVSYTAEREANLRAQTPASVQAAVRRYLATSRGFTVEVLPGATPTP